MFSDRPGVGHMGNVGRHGGHYILQALNILSLRFVAAAAIFLPLIVLLLLPSPTTAVNVLTQHNDNFRTGADLEEFVLTTSNLSAAHFGKVFSRSVDGQLYAQPLYVHAVTISNQFRNVVYVCTESNSVYAFDADNAAASNALWHVNLGPPVPISDLNNCGDLSPIVGITSTPVIDPTTGTMYVEAKTVESGNYFHRLHALDIATGQEKFGGPVVIQGTVSGTGDGSNTVTFSALHVFNRPGLLLLNNVVYMGFGGHCDWPPYHGWLIGCNATNLQQVSIFCTTPNGSEGAIWSGGMGPAADSNGNIYVMTGNGTFDKNTGGPDLGDAFIKLTPSNSTLAVTDWFVPHNQATLNADDLDLGSGGPILLPTNLVVGLGKEGNFYVLDCNRMGQFVPSADTNAVQVFAAAPQSTGIGQSSVYWNGPTNQFFYLWTANTVLTAYDYTGTNLVTGPLAMGSTVQSDRAGGTSLSANHNVAGSGIVWGIEAGSGGTIHAYDAGNVGQELWNSQIRFTRDSLGSYVKFASPTIANGKVYAPTGANQLVVYGLLTAPYQLWRQANFTAAELTNSAISGDTADPDGDGIPNLMEYALGLNPKVPSLSGLPVAGIQNIGGTSYLAMSYKEVLYNTDISYTVQVSGDLTTWNSGPGFTKVVGSPVDNGDGTETWTVRDLVPSGPLTARFLRLQVTH